MLKRVMSVLVVSGVLLSGAVFAADQTTTGAPATTQVQTPAASVANPAAQAAPTAKQAVVKEHKRVEHKVSVTKSEAAAKVDKTKSDVAPAKSN